MFTTMQRTRARSTIRRERVPERFVSAAHAHCRRGTVLPPVSDRADILGNRLPARSYPAARPLAVQSLVCADRSVGRSTSIRPVRTSYFGAFPLEHARLRVRRRLAHHETPSWSASRRRHGGQERYRQISVAIVVMIVLPQLRRRCSGSAGPEAKECRCRWRSCKIVRRGYFSVMPTAYVALRHTGLEWIGQCIAAAAALVILWQFRRASMRDLVFPVATATFIVLPYSFALRHGVVSVGLAIILYCNWSSDGSSARLQSLPFRLQSCVHAHGSTHPDGGAMAAVHCLAPEQSIIRPQGANGVIDTLSTTAMSSM